MFAWLRRLLNRIFQVQVERPVAEPARPGPTAGDSGTAQGKQGSAADDGTPAVGGTPTRSMADLYLDEARAAGLEAQPYVASGDGTPITPDVTYNMNIEEAFPSLKTNPNRASRRRISALERARMKHDRWVEPKGELPQSNASPRNEVAKEPEPATGITVPVYDGPEDEGEILIVDKLDGQEVLYMERELYGTFHFRDTVLDQLELYWTYLERMKREDPDAYATYKRLGATIVPPFVWNLHDGIRDPDKPVTPSVNKKKLTPWWKVNRPGFGCLAYAMTSRVESWETNDKTGLKKGEHHFVPKFVYFNKYSQPPSEIQPTTGGDVYTLTIWWDKPHDPSWKKKGGVPGTYPIYISKDGSDIHILKMRETFKAEPKNIKNRFRTKSGGRGRKKPHAGRALKVYNTWHYPKAFQDWARDNQTDIDIFLCNIFIETATAFDGTGFGMTRVEVTNRDLAAVFSVDPRRMGYFFKDRDITLTKEGHRQRIFHLVRPHSRRLRDGTIKHYGFSFRGLREFEWAGYHVRITIPGRDHLMLNEVDIGMIDGEFVDEKVPTVGAAEFAEKLHDWIDKGRGGSA